MRSKIAITGGGTGGHLMIADVISKELLKLGVESIFIGSTKGQDREWFERSDIFKKSYFLESSGVVDKQWFKKLGSLLNILKLSKRCDEIFRENGVKAVFSVGGYSASPASFRAIKTKIPLFIHEQNAFIGRLNKILKPFSKGFYSSYESPSFSYPVDEKFFKTARDRSELKTIIFLGGSQGAKFINNLAMDLAHDLDKKGISIIHQCGRTDFERVKSFYEKSEIKAKVFDFSKDISSFLGLADICVSRSGASSLWELCANRLPAIFIPFPYAANDHQFYNAKFLNDKGLAKVFRQDESSKDRVLAEILNLNILKISKNLAGVLEKDGARIIAKDMLKKLKESYGFGDF